MKLSQAVVVVNEYTIKGADGSGSRGSTPGEYVMRYMAREGASETASSALVKDMDRYVTKYMARHDAAASLSGSAPKQIRKAGGLGGVAFSESSLSLPEEDLRRLDAAISIARQEGYPQIAVAALEGQAETILFPRYRDTGKARVFILAGEAVSEVTGRPPVPYTPPRTQFLTAEGDVIDAPPFKAPGRAERQTGSKMRPLG